jgi:hypothetical protein
MSKAKGQEPEHTEAGTDLYILASKSTGLDLQGSPQASVDPNAPIESWWRYRGRGGQGVRDDDLHPELKRSSSSPTSAGRNPSRR